jgi:type IV secretion system protein VirD4
MMQWYYWLLGCTTLCVVCLILERKSPVDLLFGNPGEFLGYWNKGFCLTGGLRATSRDQAFRNLLCVGSTGSGKTSATLLGSLFTLTRGPSSIVVLDVSGEIYKLSSGYLSKRRKRKIYCFDPLKPYDGFNPLAWCKTITDLDKVANVLIRNSGVVANSDPYWSSSAEMILSFFMQYQFFYGHQGEKNMPSVVMLLDKFMTEPEQIDELIIQTRDERLIRLYKTINAIPEKTRQSIMSTAITATKLFRSPDVARCTSFNTFNLSDFRKESSVLYLCIPLQMVHLLAPLTAVLFELLFQEALSRIPERDELPLFMCIDEMMTMKLDLGLVFSNCRKYKMGCMGILQDEKMLLMKYSYAEAFAIKSNACSRVYLPGQSLDTCKELQELIGKCLVQDENGKERYTYGLEAAQIRTGEHAIAFVNASLPFRLRVVPYFEHILNNARTKIEPHIPEEKLKVLGKNSNSTNL